MRRGPIASSRLFGAYEVNTCSTCINGGAREVSLSFPRERAERIILHFIETELLNPAKLSELEERYRFAAARPTVDHSRRIVELDSESRHIGDVIARRLVSAA